LRHNVQNLHVRVSAHGMSCHSLRCGRLCRHSRLHARLRRHHVASRLRSRRLRHSHARVRRSRGSNRSVGSGSLQSSSACR
jgi:hypothetical protein